MAKKSIREADFYETGYSYTLSLISGKYKPEADINQMREATDKYAAAFGLLESSPSDNPAPDRYYEGEEKNERGMRISKEIRALIATDPYITQAELTELLNVSRAVVQRLMKTMTDRGIIKHVGSRNGGYWRIYPT